VLVTGQIGNVGLLEGGGKMTEGGQGERGRHADVHISAQWKWLVINRPQQCGCCISSPLSVPDASWLLLLLECPGGWFIT